MTYEDGVTDHNPPLVLQVHNNNYVVLVLYTDILKFG